MPDGNYNLGVAHGVPGVIGLLAEACKGGISVDHASPLLDGAVQWLLAQKGANPLHSVFPNVVVPGAGVPPDYSRLAWCYGDLGIAATLLGAARCVGRAEWEQEAVDLARRAAGRSPETSGVRDASLCHGAAGVAHLFNRMYQATGDPPLREAARFWYRHTLALRRPGEWLAGFYAWEPVTPTELRQAPTTGFLTGAAGVGLCLLAATSDVEPAWDRVLLVSTPLPVLRE
jgi:hypothetical protein